MPQIRLGDGAHRGLHHARVKRLLVEHDVGLDDAAAVAAGHAFALENMLDVIRFFAAHAVIAPHRSVQLEHVLAACFLVQIVDVLGDNGGQPACLFKLRQLQMGRVGKASILSR